MRKHTATDIWKLVDVRSADECWDWIGPLNSWGYGRIGFNNRSWLAHRLVWELTNGKIPNGMLLMHFVCDNPKCCNPNHLKVGTNKENSEDCSRKKRTSGQKKTHCPKGHPYSGKNLIYNSSGGRMCHICVKKMYLKHKYKNIELVRTKQNLAWNKKKQNLKLIKKYELKLKSLGGT